MKDIFNNIDELILTKSYKDLSADELISISELASNESDFNQLKATMLAVQKQISNEEMIEAKPETKAALMREFKAARPAVIASSSRMGLGFFFPKGKSLAQMPGLQILTAAACLLMIITVLRNVDLNGTGKRVAYEETTEEAKVPNSTEVATEQNKEEKDLTIETKNETPVINQKNDIEEVTALINDAKTIESTDKLEITFGGNVATGASTGKFTIPTLTDTPTEDVEIAEYDQEDLLSEIVVEESEEEIALEKEVMMDDEVALVRANSTATSRLDLADATVNPQATKDFKKKTDQKSVKLSRTLEQDSELIDLFYTAM